MFSGLQNRERKSVLQFSRLIFRFKSRRIPGIIIVALSTLFIKFVVSVLEEQEQSALSLRLFARTGSLSLRELAGELYPI